MVKAKKMTSTLGVATVVSLAALQSVSAQITFVDATTSNTGPGAAITTADSQTDNLWNNDSYSVLNGGKALQGGYAGSEDPPELTTTVNVDNGAYDVYVFFWQKWSSSSYGIAAGTTSGSLTQYSTASAASALEFTNDPKTEYTPHGWYMKYALLGEVSVTGGTLEVYIDDYSSGGGYTYYDGIGYRVVPPPPGTLLTVR